MASLVPALVLALVVGVLGSVRRSLRPLPLHVQRLQCLQSQIVVLRHWLLLLLHAGWCGRMSGLTSSLLS